MNGLFIDSFHTPDKQLHRFIRGRIKRMVAYMTDYVLGVDIGSGSVKLTLLGREGKIAATAGCE